MADWKEKGMATAEYATGMLGAVVIATILIRFGNESWFYEQLKEVFSTIMDTLDIFNLPMQQWGWRWLV